MSKSDITFAMLADPAAAMAVAIGYPDIAAVNGITAGKGYIDCSTVSVDCSQRIAAEVIVRTSTYALSPVEHRLGMNGCCCMSQMEVSIRAAYPPPSRNRIGARSCSSACKCVQMRA